MIQNPDYGRLVKDPEALQTFLDHAFAGDARRRVVMVVGNRIAGDSRVLKSALSLAERGFEVVLVGLRPLPNDFAHGYIEGIPFLLVDAGELSTGADEDGHVEAVRAIGVRLARGLAAARFAILYTHDYWGLALGLHVMQGCGAGQALYWVHDVHEYLQGYAGILPAGRLAYAINVERSCIALPDRLVFVNERIADLLCAEFGLDSQARLVVHNAPRTQRASAFDVRRAIGLDAQVPLGVYLGRATAARGLDILIPALRELSALHFALLSSAAADYLAELQALAAKAGVAERLHVFPYVPDSEVASAVASASFGLSPLTRYGNSDLAVPTKVLEFIHAELAMVVSDATFQADFVRTHSLGEVFAAREPASFVAAVRAVLAGRYAPDWQALKREYSWEGQFGAVSAAIEAHAEGDRIAPRGVFQGPGFSAGQPSVLARGLRALGTQAQAISLALAGGGSDACWPDNGLSAQASLAQWAAQRFGVVHLHARPFMDATDRDAAYHDLALLRASGCRVVFQFRGNEVRTQELLRAANPFAWDLPAGASAQAQALLEAVRACADLVLVTDPELRTYVPEAQVLPLAVELDALPFVGAQRRTRPRIAHAATALGARGSEALGAALEAMRRVGIDFEFVALEGLAPNALRAALAEADVFVDQLVVGWYGPLAVEAMARGKAVVAFIRDDLEQELPDGVLVNANPRTIEARLRELVADDDWRAALGAAARQHVEAQHASAVVAARLQQMVGELAAQAPRAAWPAVFGAVVDQVLSLRERAQRIADLELQLDDAEKAMAAVAARAVAEPAAASKPALVAKSAVVAKVPAAPKPPRSFGQRLAHITPAKVANRIRRLLGRA